MVLTMFFCGLSFHNCLMASQGSSSESKVSKGWFLPSGQMPKISSRRDVLTCVIGSYYAIVHDQSDVSLRPA